MGGVGLHWGPQAALELQDFVQTKYLQKVTSKADLEALVGKGAVISKFHVVERVKFGKVKRRLILDLKQSGMTKRTRRTRRVVLPRATDLVQDLLFSIVD